jgi:hypothetical protein
VTNDDPCLIFFATPNSRTYRRRTYPDFRIKMEKMFDPAHERRLLDGDVGYRLNLGSDFGKSKSVGGLASSAHANLNTAVQCLLVGYDDVAEQLLKRACDWLTVAINEQEKPHAYAANGTEAQRQRDLAMCNWLLKNVHDAECLNQFVEYEDRFLLGSKIGRDKTNVSLTLVGYLDAREYGNALERFSGAALRVPKSPRLIRNEGQMCYVICRRRLGQEYSDSDVESAAFAFLRQNMNRWLTGGHFLRAGEWMKVVHWHEENAGHSARAAVLNCYKYLASVEPPAS